MSTQVLTVDLGDGNKDTLHLAGLPRHVFDELLAAHTSSTSGQPWDVDSLAPALIAACVTDPTLTVEDARYLWEEWSTPDADAVFTACLTLCVPDGVDRARLRVQHEPRLALEMAYCGPRGIPHSRFLGRTGEPDWTPADQDLAVAWLLTDTTRCPSCGATPNGSYEVTLTRCAWCEQLTAARDAVPQDQKGVHVYLTPVEGG